MARREKRGGMVSSTGLVQVAGGFSQTVSAGSVPNPATGKRRRLQFRLFIAIDESRGSPEQRRALAHARLVDLLAMRDALVDVDRGEEAEYLLRQAGAVASDAVKFNFAIAAANVVMSRPSEEPNEARSKYSTWGQLATAWATQTLAAEYPNAGYGKRTGEDTDKPRVDFFCKYIGNAPLATFSDNDYWRAMRPARARSKTDSTFKAYSQVLRRVLKIAVELQIIKQWPLSAVCKLPKVAKGSGPEFPFLYPDEYVRLVRCPEVPIGYRVLWGFIIREGLRIGEAIRIRWEHLSRLPNGRWLLDVPDTKTGRALNFVLNVGTGEVLDAFRRVLVDGDAHSRRLLTVAQRRKLDAGELDRKVPAGELAGPFAWLKPSAVNHAAKLLRKHVEMSGTTRARLLYTQGRLRRLREHDLRSTFVTWCKLAKVDNETISAHTGHESSTMIARYNRSKATIEHLGLPPYLPLDEAMCSDVAGELGEGPGPLLLGAGEPDEGMHETNASAVSSPLHQTSAAASGLTPSHLTSDTAADEPGGEPTADQPPSPPLGASLPPSEGEGAWHPCCGACGRALPSGRGQYTATCPACGEPWDGSELGAEGLGEGRPRRSVAGARKNESAGEYHAQGEVPEAVLAAVRGGYRAAIEGSRDPRGITAEGAPVRSSRDGSRDALSRGLQTGGGADSESSMFSAVRETGFEPARPYGHWNLNPAFGDRRKQNPQKPGGEPAPEATGSDLASRAPVTLLDQLRAAARQAVDEDNWPALKALEPLIEAERARLAKAEVARRDAEPVRLEVVRARRDGGAK